MHARDNRGHASRTRCRFCLLPLLAWEGLLVIGLRGTSLPFPFSLHRVQDADAGWAVPFTPILIVPSSTTAGCLPLRRRGRPVVF